MMSKDAYYFPHDSNAYHDSRIVILRATFGLEGYGFYFAILELLRNQTDYMLPNNTVDILSFTLNTDKDKLNQMLHKCIEIGLFVQDEEYLYSEQFLNRMKLIDEKRNKRVEAGRKGGIAKASNYQVPSNGKAMLGQGSTIKEKESKVKKRKGKKSKPVYENPPTQTEFIQYFKDKGYKQQIAEQAYLGYSEGNWHDASGNIIYSWKQKVANSWFKPQNLAVTTNQSNWK